MMRKKILILLAVSTLAMMAAGCKKEDGKENKIPEASPSPTAGITEPVPTPESNEKEAPELSKLVEERKLPALEFRLPVGEDIMVLSAGQNGKYGKSAKLAVINADTVTGELVSEGLFSLDEEGNVVPNIAKGYEVNGDNTQYTIHLRKGMRWSDGVPFTADDCVFFYEKMCVPQVFGEKLWKCFLNDSGERASFSKVDETTFLVSFKKPKPDFLKELLEQGGICFAPEHYYVNLLPEYMGNDAALAKAKSMGYSGVEEMLRATMKQPWNVVGVPNLNPFFLSEEEGKGDVKGDYYEYVRNPYYWKTDGKGKQLPYLDKLEFTRISDENQGLLLTTEGYLTVYILKEEQLKQAGEGQERGGYGLVSWGDKLHVAINNELRNFPTAYSLEADLRGIGASHAESWFFE